MGMITAVSMKGKGKISAAVSMKGKGKLSERSSRGLGYFGSVTSTASRSLGVEVGHQEEMIT